MQIIEDEFSYIDRHNQTKTCKLIGYDHLLVKTTPNQKHKSMPFLFDIKYKTSRVQTEDTSKLPDIAGFELFYLNSDKRKKVYQLTSNS